MIITATVSNVARITEENDRRDKLAERSGYWLSFCTAEKGYDWRRTSARTEHLQREFLAAGERFIRGEVEIKEVHAAFVEFAKAHKMRYVVNQMNRRTRQTEKIACVTPQAEFQAETFERAQTVFGITADEYWSNQYATQQ
jgi:hypothetical protein